MPLVRVAQIVERTEAEGPGTRFALWVQGCPLRCPGCCNPKMLPFEGGEAVPVDALARRALDVHAVTPLEGVSLLGGEPFGQAVALAAFARAVRREGLGVMIFSGFTLGELHARRDAAEPGVGELLDACDLLVDGRYERDRPDTRRRWIGSENQTMHFLSDRHRADDPALSAPNTVEIRLGRGGLAVNGWPALADRLVGRR